MGYEFSGTSGSEDVLAAGAKLAAGIYDDFGAGAKPTVAQRVLTSGSTVFAGDVGVGGQRTLAVVFKGSSTVADLAADRLRGGPQRVWAAHEAADSGRLVDGLVRRAKGRLEAGGRVLVAGHSLGGFLGGEFMARLRRELGGSWERFGPMVDFVAIDPMGFGPDYANKVKAGDFAGARLHHVDVEGSVARAGSSRVELKGRLAALADRLGAREALEEGNGLTQAADLARAAGVVHIRARPTEGMGALASHSAKALSNGLSELATSAAEEVGRLDGGRVFKWRRSAGRAVEEETLEVGRGLGGPG